MNFSAGLAAAARVLLGNNSAMSDSKICLDETHSSATARTGHGRAEPQWAGEPTHSRLGANVSESLKRGLVRLGALCPPRLLWVLDGMADYLWVGHWMKQHALRPEKFAAGTRQIFSIAADDIADRQVLYLEFGVFRGWSMTVWSRLLRNANSKLHGFDSFEGLPESWSAIHAQGDMTTSGAIPHIDDPRVTFYKGWFDETLPCYSPPPFERLFINIDCDTYSSAKTVLKFLHPHISAGTYLYFDEFHHRWHELKAFDEFLTDSGLRFRLVAADKRLSRVLFQCTA